MSGHVYTLQLEGGNYYVGWSSDPCSRIAQHFLGRGSQWTRTHRPESVLCIQPGDHQLERAVTIARMCQHGWQKVRGGPWLAPVLLYPPQPITNALMHRPPPPLHHPQQVDHLHGHSIVWHRFPKRFRARIFGPKASAACSKRGFKEVNGETREEVVKLVEGWLARTGEEGVKDERDAAPSNLAADSVQAAMELMDSLSFSGAEEANRCG